MIGTVIAPLLLPLALGAVPIRSIDPSDADFADLQPLAAAIGSAAWFSSSDIEYYSL